MSCITSHNPSHSPHVALVLVAKQAIAGHVKTRLAADGLSLQTAAAVHEVFLHHMRDLCESLAALPCGIDLMLLFDPPNNIDAWKNWKPWLKIPQSRGHLGCRLESAWQTLSRAPLAGAIFIGADVPELTAEHIIWARDQLREFRHAMIPAHDGGYVLIGIPAGGVSLFQDIAWGTPQVADQTRWNAAQSESVLSELPPLHDVDTREDLTALQHRLSSAPGERGGYLRQRLIETLKSATGVLSE